MTPSYEDFYPQAENEITATYGVRPPEQPRKGNEWLPTDNWDLLVHIRAKELSRETSTEEWISER